MVAGVESETMRHRDQLTDVLFIAVTGSSGKSTATHLAATLLRTALRGAASPGSANCGRPLAANILGVSPSDDFYIQELGAWGPGTLDAGLRLVQPRIGVVLNIRRDHLSAYHGLDETQAEKAKVVASLPAEGTAVLNLDDARVGAMRAMTAAHVVTFGRRAGADFRADEVSARWPDRLRFRLTHGGTSHRVQTRLIGEQCLGSVLGAIAVATVAGVAMEVIVQQLTAIEPLPRRLSAVTVPGDVTFIRDDFKAPSDSLTDALEFMAAARAERKVGVVGRISDCPGRSRPTYTAFALAAMDVFDELLFVGERADSLWRSGAKPWDAPAGTRARVTVLPTVTAAAQMLERTLRAGDLVLLKGSGPADHLERVLLQRTVGVRCWLPDCRRVTACDECPFLHRPSRPRPASTAVT